MTAPGGAPAGGRMTISPSGGRVCGGREARARDVSQRWDRRTSSYGLPLGPRAIDLQQTNWTGDGGDWRTGAITALVLSRRFSDGLYLTGAGAAANRPQSS